jgi:hypothetical protein
MYYIKSSMLGGLVVDYIDSLPYFPASIYPYEYEGYMGSKENLIELCKQAAIDNGWGNIRLLKDAWRTAAPNEDDEVILFSMLRRLVFCFQTSQPPVINGVLPVKDLTGDEIPDVFKDTETVGEDIVIYQRWDSGTSLSWAIADIWAYSYAAILIATNPDFGFLEHYLVGNNPYHAVYNDMSGLPEIEIHEDDLIPGNPLYHPMLMREGYDRVGSWVYAPGTAYLQVNSWVSPYNYYPIAQYYPPYKRPQAGVFGAGVIAPVLGTIFLWMLKNAQRKKQ